MLTCITLAHIDGNGCLSDSGVLLDLSCVMNVSIHQAVLYSGVQIGDNFGSLHNILSLDQLAIWSNETHDIGLFLPGKNQSLLTKDSGGFMKETIAHIVSTS